MKNMDPKQAVYVKIGISGLAVIVVGALAFAGKVGGADAMTFVKWIVTALLGGVAVIGASAAQGTGQFLGAAARARAAEIATSHEAQRRMAVARSSENSDTK